MKFLFFIILSSSWLQAKEVVFYHECTSTKEFVTTVEYLRSKKEFQIELSQAIKVADKVAAGCTGAAQKFVDVANLLVKLTVDSKSAIETAAMLSSMDRGVVDNFLTIFKYAFVQDGLDLDLATSLAMAKKLSVEFSGEQKKAQDDFLILVKFCTTMKELNLPIGSCSASAGRITAMGEHFKNSIARPFTDLFEFLTDDSDGPKLSKIEALKLAEEMMSFGPMAKENFIQAYQYAISKNGLGHQQTQAIGFAKNLAKTSFKIEK